MRLNQFLLTLAIASMGLGSPMIAQAQLTTTAELSAPVYHLGPGDKIKVSVFGSQDLSGEYNVNDSGAIDYPLLGSVDVRQFTASQLQETLRNRLGGGYLVNPKVTVEIVKFRPFYVYGEVMRGGEYPFTTRMTIQQAIATAGGLSYRASVKNVFLQHAGQTGEVKYNLRRDYSVLISPGDTVRVGERHF